MKFYDICCKKTYTKDGVEKATWPKVGVYKETDDGKKFIELNIFPSTSFYCFEQKSKEDKPKEETSWDN